MYYGNYGIPVAAACGFESDHRGSQAFEADVQSVFSYHRTPLDVPTEKDTLSHAALPRSSRWECLLLFITTGPM